MPSLDTHHYWGLQDAAETYTCVEEQCLRPLGLRLGTVYAGAGHYFVLPRALRLSAPTDSDRPACPAEMIYSVLTGMAVGLWRPRVTVIPLKRVLR